MEEKINLNIWGWTAQWPEGIDVGKGIQVRIQSKAQR